MPYPSKESELLHRAQARIADMDVQIGKLKLERESFLNLIAKLSQEVAALTLAAEKPVHV